MEFMKESHELQTIYTGAFGESYLPSLRTYLQKPLQTSSPTAQKSYTKFQKAGTTFENYPICEAKFSIA